MGFDPKALLVKTGAEDALGKALAAAYQLGYDDALARLVSLAQAAGGGGNGGGGGGGAELTTAPMQTPWSAPAPQREARNAAEHVEARSPMTFTDSERPRKARRGLVGPTIDAILKANPGLTIADYEGLVLKQEPEIAIKTVGNHLRSGERTGRYRRDRPGGYQWYLVEKNETEPDDFVGPIGSASSHSSQEGGDGHGPAQT